MIFPVHNKSVKPESVTIKGVILRSSHVVIESKLVEQVFGNDARARLVYYAKNRTLMLAAETNELFTQLHKTKQHMLKSSNLKGDKSIALHEILIDNEIEDSDRELVYEVPDKLLILKILL